MYIKSLELKNYRNYESLCINISPGTNILYGDNAQGKTNILEALYLAGTTKSHRGSKDREIIQFDREEAHIRMMVERNGSTHKIDMHLKKNKSKGIAIDGCALWCHNGFCLCRTAKDAQHYANIWPLPRRFGKSCWKLRQNG